jgi:hypothetical protein
MCAPHRMQYAHFRELGMFAGSGAVEAGCKAVIGQRLKLSGMRWSLPGAVRGLLIAVLTAVTAPAAGTATAVLAATQVASFGSVIIAVVAVTSGLATTVTTALAVAHGLDKLIRRE